MRSGLVSIGAKFGLLPVDRTVWLFLILSIFILDVVSIGRSALVIGILYSSGEF